MPRAAGDELAALSAPAFVSDRTDGKIAHLDGLNLSRARCWRGIGAALGEPERFAEVAERTSPPPFRISARTPLARELRAIGTRSPAVR